MGTEEVRLYKVVYTFKVESAIHLGIFKVRAAAKSLATQAIAEIITRCGMKPWEHISTEEIEDV